MDSQDMQVIGLCRFSWPAIGGFQVEHDSIEERSAYLYSPERMEERFRTFEALTLPPLKTQTDQNFQFLVVIGDDLPPHYRERLVGLLDGLPQAVIQERPPGPHRPVMQEAINSLRDGRTEPCLQFRMDDDDAVGIHYVERLRDAAQDLRPLLRKNRHVAIDFNQGWIVRPTANGLDAKPTVEPLWTAGLAVSAKKSVKNTVMNFGHSRLARFMPVVSFTGEDMFIRGHNAHNDSRQKANVRPVRLDPLDAKGEAHLRKVFNIDANRVRDLYRDA
ncbi:putative rhamnosyl transferase [Shimia thalassica]|uniref:putative rhamnosyl transferase n=1 Tax=Shimia thalassica TaxID=1715693 RepID=UPI0027376FAA|nr:putative rhamnosyl transferase [Shimia thalassica]MDP2582386.1 putative rhamnosyl transferase [Shimia thalassica]